MDRGPKTRPSFLDDVFEDEGLSVGLVLYVSAL